MTDARVKKFMAELKALALRYKAPIFMVKKAPNFYIGKDRQRPDDSHIIIVDYPDRIK